MGSGPRHGVHGWPRTSALLSIVCLASLVFASTGLAQLNHIQSAANLLSQGQLDQAETEARKGLEQSSTRALALAMLGTIRLQQGKYQESASFLRRALALNPQLSGARTTLGNAYLLQHKPEEARRSFEQALRLDPANFNARFDLAKMEADLQNYRQSLDVAGPIERQLNDSDDGIVLLATDYGGLGDKAALEALVGNWRSIPTPAEDPTFKFAGILVKYGMTPEAKEVLESEETRMAAHPAPLPAYKLGEAYFSLGFLERAEQSFQLALSLDPACVACERNLAQLAERQGDTEKALAYLVKARQQAPEDPETLFAFGKVCLERNLLEDALPALTKAVSLRPDRDPYVYVLASANVAKGNLSEAASLLGGLLQKHPKDAVLNYAMGAVYYLQGRYTDAEHSLKQSLKVQSEQVAASYYLGLTYDALGQDDQAVSVFRNLLQNHPEHAPSCLKLGSILLRQHQYEEAQHHLEHAVSLDPGSQEAHYQLGLLLRRLGRISESQSHFEESRRLEAERAAQSDKRLRLLLPD